MQDRNASAVRLLEVKQEAATAQQEATTAQAEASRAKAAVEEATDNTTCVICLDKSRSCLYLPCAHLATCGGCDTDLESGGAGGVCPICQQGISSRIRRQASDSRIESAAASSSTPGEGVAADNASAARNQRAGRQAYMNMRTWLEAEVIKDSSLDFGHRVPSRTQRLTRPHPWVGRAPTGPI